MHRRVGRITWPRHRCQYGVSISGAANIRSMAVSWKNKPCTKPPWPGWSAIPNWPRAQARSASSRGTRRRARKLASIFSLTPEGLQPEPIGLLIVESGAQPWWRNPEDSPNGISSDLARPFEAVAGDLSGGALHRDERERGRAFPPAEPKDQQP